MLTMIVALIIESVVFEDKKRSPGGFGSFSKAWQGRKLSFREEVNLLDTNHITFELWLKQDGYK